MKIVLLEPFYTGSHKAWADEFADHSRHDVTMLTLPGRHWKWRMYGGAVALADKYNQLDFVPDLILATDMIDLTAFLALTRAQTSGIPTVLYFHENQLTYPWSPDDQDVNLNRDAQYKFINYTSALVADHVCFNSRYHLDSFLDALPVFLKCFPDCRNLENVQTIKNKSRVLHLGMDLSKFDQYKDKSSKNPLFLWNHRWEYDKNPKVFFEAMYELDARGFDFSLAILGQAFGKSPEIFEQAKKKLKHKIIKWGYAKTFEEYAGWLHRADVLPVTSNQDFFGMSIVEAVYCGCIPCLPRRLTYPELLSGEFNECFFDDDERLVDKLIHILSNLDKFNKKAIRETIARFDWQKKIIEYDDFFAKAAKWKQFGKKP